MAPSPPVPGPERAQRLRRVGEGIACGNFEQVRAEAEALLQDFPADFEVYKLAGVVALGRRDLERAYPLFTRARELARHPAERALACAGVCETLMEGGEGLQAEAYVREALALQPGNPEYPKLLARCQLNQGHPDRAIAGLQDALASQPPHLRAGLKLHLAGLMMQAGRAPEALSLLEELERAHPDDPQVWLSHASLCQVTGDPAGALRCYERALALDPRLPYHYAMLESLDREAAGRRAALEQELAQAPAGNTRLHIDLEFALARACDAADDTDAAFRHLQRGNALKRAGLHYQEAAEVALFESITALFDKGVLERHGRAGRPGPVQPIFIVGMPRSGTTLAEQILGAHPQVAAAGELGHIGTLAMEFMTRWSPRAGDLDRHGDALSRDLAAMAGRYLALLAERAGTRNHVTDKAPLNFRYLGLIRLLFPEAPIVHCLRDPLDSCFSCYQLLFEGVSLPFAYDLHELAEYHRLYRRYMEHWSRVLPVAPHGLVYEDLVSDLDTQVRGLLDYCRLPFDPVCLDFHKVERTVQTASATQVRKPVYGTSVGRWRRYERHLGALIQGLAG